MSQTTPEIIAPPSRLTSSKRELDQSPNAFGRLRASTDVAERWVGPNPIGHGLAAKRGRIC